ncbi:MAG: type II restriction endonuclease, partial [Methylacidiphilales bacterium]|nr:type II restriction endonuclease [Candidatus Methylacidiphilales bacterium]
QFAELIHYIGFENILQRRDLEDVLYGVQIGLETHRRKNVAGQAFHNEVAALLEHIKQQLASNQIAVEIQTEMTIRYGNGLSKKVDFALLQNGSPRYGFEVNFYTVQGSKPTEIKRSYGDITRGLRQVGVELIWITDGKGYRNMQSSLRDAYITMPNIYNLRQARENLFDDLLIVLK